MNIHRFYKPFQLYFRRRRMRLFEEQFGVSDDTRIIDVGGYELNWSLLTCQPRVLLVNLEEEHYERAQFTKIRGDGRQLPYDDRSFDIAYSNSVIEHVGTTEDQRAFAAQIRRVATGYYVQTPNKWFFVEPHLLGVFIHYLPARMTRRLVRRLTIWGLVERPTQARIDNVLGSIRLLDKREMQRLFPDAEIHEERVLGMTKSLIAIRRPPIR